MKHFARHVLCHTAAAWLLLGLAGGTVAHAETLAIVGARVLVRPGLALPEATVVIVDGKIAAVGAGVAVPAGARTIDGQGNVVTAGLIDAFSQVGLSEIDLEPGSSDGDMAPALGTTRATYRAADAIDPFSIMHALARSAGITSVIAAPRGVLVGGQSAWSSMGADAREPLRATAALHAELGPSATVAKSRGASVAELRDLLATTQAWRRDKGQYQRQPRDKNALSLAELTALEPVLTRQQPLVVDARAVADIRAALALAREFGLRLVIVGATEAWLVADELAAAGVPVIMDPQNILPGRINAPRVTINAAGKLRAAGVHVAFSTFGAAWSSVTLRQYAGIAIADGLAYDDALAALTTVPAGIYAPTQAARPQGTPPKAAPPLPSGTLEVGARADVVVWSGDPFELSTWAKVVIIGGVEQKTDTRQQELFRRYR